MVVHILFCDDGFLVPLMFISIQQGGVHVCNMT
jgi:hypothetical protein